MPRNTGQWFVFLFTFHDYKNRFFVKLGCPREQRQHHKERRDGQSVGDAWNEKERRHLKLPHCTKNQIVKNTPELTKHVYCCDHMPSLY